MNSPSCARSFYQQRTAKQILTRFVASFFFYILYISRLRSRSKSTNTNKLNERNLFIRPKRKKSHLPTSNRAYFFFPWNKSLALTHVQPKRKKTQLATSTSLHVLKKQWEIHTTDDRRVTWFHLIEREKNLSLGTGGVITKSTRVDLFCVCNFNSRGFFFIFQNLKKLPFPSQVSVPSDKRPSNKSTFSQHFSSTEFFIMSTHSRRLSNPPSMPPPLASMTWTLWNLKITHPKHVRVLFLYHHVGSEVVEG